MQPMGPNPEAAPPPDLELDAEAMAVLIHFYLKRTSDLVGLCVRDIKNLAEVDSFRVNGIIPLDDPGYAEGWLSVMRAADNSGHLAMKLGVVLRSKRRNPVYPMSSIYDEVVAALHEASLPIVDTRLGTGGVLELTYVLPSTPNTA